MEFQQYLINVGIDPMSAFLIASAIYPIFIGILTLYLKKRTEGLAKDKYVREIAASIKEIERKITNETDILRKELKFISSFEANMIRDEINAIVDFNRKFSIWSEYFLNMKYITDSMRTNENIDNYILKSEILKDDLIKSLTMVDLFVNDQKIISLSHELKNDTFLPFNQLVNKIVTISRMVNDTLDGFRDWGTTKEPLSIDKLKKQRNIEILEFQKDITKKWKDISKKHNEYVKNCRKHLYGLTKGQNIPSQESIK